VKRRRGPAQKIPKKGVASPGVRPANENNSTGRLHANFVDLAKNLTERKGLRARKNQGSLTPASAFENRSEEKANAYFAVGIQDEILTRLSKIADLKAIPRTSTQHYKTAPENLPRSPGNLASRTSWKAACRRAATIGPRFSDASLVDCRLANHGARARNAGRGISVDRLFAAKIVTSGESQGYPAHYLRS